MKVLLATLIIIFTAHQVRAFLSGLEEFRKEVEGIESRHGSLRPFSKKILLQRTSEVEEATNKFEKTAQPIVGDVMALIFHEHTMLMAIIRVGTLNPESVLANTMISEMCNQYEAMRSSIGSVNAFHHGATENSLTLCLNSISKLQRVLKEMIINVQGLADNYLSVENYCRKFYSANYIKQ